MTDVFKQLQKSIDLKKHEEGISPLDIADLPANLRKVLKIILREAELTLPEIKNEMMRQRDAERLTDEELRDALKILTRQMWLIRRGEGESVRYEVNLRRKTGRESGGIWSVLDEKLEQQQARQNYKPGSPE